MFSGDREGVIELSASLHMHVLHAVYAREDVLTMPTIHWKKVSLPSVEIDKWIIRDHHFGSSTVQWRIYHLPACQSIFPPSKILTWVLEQNFHLVGVAIVTIMKQMLFYISLRRLYASLYAVRWLINIQTKVETDHHQKCSCKNILKLYQISHQRRVGKKTKLNKII